MTEESELRSELDEARAIIAQQALQISRLERQGAGDGGTEVLATLLELSTIAGVTIGEAPYRSLLNGIIEAAKRLFDAGAASISLLDHDTGELVFAAAAETHLIGLRFPAHQGIAGWVMMTGEPIAVGDVRRDPRFSQAFASSTGYVPQSIMAVPLIVQDEVEGVLSVLDKASAASFGLDDLELLGLFARPAAIAVEQARTTGAVGRMLLDELARLARDRGDTATSGAILSAVAQSGQVAAETLELARLVQTLGRRGDRGRQLAREVLAAVVRSTV